jgi:hypothetical protein
MFQSVSRQQGDFAMIRHRCVACGRSINRTDRFFEPSDGTLCLDCLSRLASGRSAATRNAPGADAAAPLLGRLPEMAADALRQR